jgi:xylulokinase
VRLVTHEGGEAGGALGAARLAWLCVGGDLATVCAAPPVLAGFEPDAAMAGLLSARLGRFRALYPALRGHFNVSA